MFLTKLCEREKGAETGSLDNADKEVSWIKLIISDEFRTSAAENILIVKYFLINLFQDRCFHGF